MANKNICGRRKIYDFPTAEKEINSIRHYLCYFSGGGGGGAVNSVFGRTGTVTAQSNDYTFAQLGSKPTTLSGYGITDAGSINAVYNPQTGTTYTLQSSDNGKVVTLSNASAITLTVPASLPAGFNCSIVQLGAGQVTITPSSTTVHNRQSFTKTAGQYAMATLLMYTIDTFISQGDMA